MPRNTIFPDLNGSNRMNGQQMKLSRKRKGKNEDANLYVLTPPIRIDHEWLSLWRQKDGQNVQG